MQIKCPEITCAINILKSNGNDIVEEIESWSGVKLDINMAKPLDLDSKNKIVSDIKELEYWEYQGSPHNPADNGFVCKQHSISITFPLK